AAAFVATVVACIRRSPRRSKAGSFAALLAASEPRHFVRTVRRKPFASRERRQAAAGGRRRGRFVGRRGAQGAGRAGRRHARDPFTLAPRLFDRSEPQVSEGSFRGAPRARAPQRSRRSRPPRYEHATPAVRRGAATPPRSSGTASAGAA